MSAERVLLAGREHLQRKPRSRANGNRHARSTAVRMDPRQDGHARHSAASRATRRSGAIDP
jgi:hypothetical protein